MSQLEAPKFFEPKDKGLDPATLEAKYGRFWIVATNCGAARDIRTPEGRDELRADITRLCNQILDIAKQNGIEVTRVKTQTNLPISSTYATKILDPHDGEGWDVARREAGLLRHGERTVDLLRLVEGQGPINGHREQIGDTYTYPFMRAEVRDEDLRRLNNLLVNPSAYRIATGMMSIENPTSATIHSMESSIGDVDSLEGSFTIIAKEPAPISE
ncbi:hypothetical protein A2Z00_00310 [Candidatus Gottesmanbacteria bacterium RBG_13_45_10]|uniref:Uncharacterized protein n=1 Tax=Candidatus Gottesmanbacteria bacterium RBG_13_45_10 TaxID=1798370 RepID=A0A1F5ZH89_9BACT|nr:MAG: hypothetical protein A2Z00_00310 [Candidatus Gottesmanbacteria bacterium RBG_13_45_10]